MNSLYLIEIVKNYKEFIQGSIKVAEFNPMDGFYKVKGIDIDYEIIRRLKKISFK